MKLHDPDRLIPNHDHLMRIVASHPFDRSLSDRIRQITVRRSEQFGIARENVEIDMDTAHVLLGIGESTPDKTNYDFVLYHEFGHVADIMCAEFEYSDELKRELSDTERICVMELWNVYINSRLNAVGLYAPSGSVGLGTLNGVRQRFPETSRGELMVHMATLEREGFSHKRAKELVLGIWEDPGVPWTYPGMIQEARKVLGEPFAPRDGATSCASPA